MKWKTVISFMFIVAAMVCMGTTAFAQYGEDPLAGYTPQELSDQYGIAVDTSTTGYWSVGNDGSYIYNNPTSMTSTMWSALDGFYNYSPAAAVASTTGNSSIAYGSQNIAYDRQLTQLYGAQTALIQSSLSDTNPQEFQQRMSAFDTEIAGVHQAKANWEQAASVSMQADASRHAELASSYRELATGWATAEIGSGYQGGNAGGGYNAQLGLPGGNIEAARSAPMQQPSMPANPSGSILEHLTPAEGRTYGQSHNTVTSAVGSMNVTAMRSMKTQEKYDAFDAALSSGLPEAAHAYAVQEDLGYARAIQTAHAVVGTMILGGVALSGAAAPAALTGPEAAAALPEASSSVSLLTGPSTSAMLEGSAQAAPLALPAAETPLALPAPSTIYLGAAGISVSDVVTTNNK